MALAKRTTAAHRRRTVEEFRASGLGQAEFADKKGIKLGTLQNWLYSRRRERSVPEVTSTARFIEVDAPASRSAALVVRVGAVAVEVVELPPPGWVIEVLTGLGAR